MPRTRNCASSSSSSSSRLPGSVDEKTYKGLFGEYKHTTYNESRGRSDDLLESSWLMGDGSQPGSNKGNVLNTGSNKLPGHIKNECDTWSAFQLYGAATPKKGAACLPRHKLSKPNPFDVWMGYVSPPRKADDGFSSGSADCSSSSDGCETACTSSDPFSLPSPDQCLTPDEEDDIFVKGGVDVCDPDDIIRQICDDYNAHRCSNAVECLRDLTPGLFTSQSASCTSDIPPSIPDDGQDASVCSGSKPCSRVIDTQDRVRSKEGVTLSSGDEQLTCSNSRKRKRLTDVEDAQEMNLVTDAYTSATENINSESAPLPTLGLSKLFDREFLMHRFGFTPAFDTAQTWPCPFPSIGPACQVPHSSKGFQKHVRTHWKTFEKSHPGEALQCPWKECDLKKKSKKQAVIIGPNESLGRHILDKHMKGRGVQCSCGSFIGRAVKDQLVRHLLASNHQEKLAATRDEDPNFPLYPSIRDPLLLDEQNAWKNGGSNAAGDAAYEDVEDEKEEGSSKGHKRARHP